MPFFPWTSKLDTGIAAVDKQHKVLVDLINTLHDAMKSGRGNDVLGSILTELIDYTTVHFATEETLFQKHNYPDGASHKKIHDDLRRQVEQIKEQHAAGRTFASIELMGFLRDWLQNHILGHDQKYAPFLKQRGVA